MTALFSTVLTQDGLIMMICAAFVAGVVRGFAGFGTAMIFLPVAGQFLSPFWAIAVLTVMDLFGPLPLVKSAWRDADRPDLGRLVLGMIITLPFALWMLAQLDPQVFRYAVSFIALAMLVILGFGLRYTGTVRPKLVLLTGGISGITGGFAGIPGPPVILFYMASHHPPAVIRANNLLFLLSFDIAILTILFTKGQIDLSAAAIGVLMVPAMMLGNIIGGWFFDPDREGMYRRIAFGIIGLSAVMGLPFFD